MEQQKKKLQNLKVTTKQSVNLDDLFEKQLPEVSRAPPFSVVQSTPPPQPPHVRIHMQFFKCSNADICTVHVERCAFRGYKHTFHVHTHHMPLINTPVSCT